MTASKDLQERIVNVLKSALPAGIEVMSWRAKDMTSDLDATAAAQSGLAVYVPVPKATSAMQGVPFVFFDRFEVRVQIIELPHLNSRTEDLYDLIELISLALHWQPKTEDSPLAGMLAHPLFLSERPVEAVEGAVSVPGFEHNGEYLRAADVIFTAVLQINAESTS